MSGLIDRRSDYERWKDGELEHQAFARIVTQELGENLSEVEPLLARIEELKRQLREVKRAEPDVQTPGFQVTIKQGHIRKSVNASKLLDLMDMIREVSPACARIIEEECISEKMVTPEPAVEWLDKPRRVRG